MKKAEASPLAQVADGVHSDRFPVLTCPHCGTLSAVAGEFVWDEAPDSRNAHDHEAWEPEWVHGTFQVPLECRVCGGIARALGRYGLVEYSDVRQWGPPDYVHRVEVDVIYPAVPLLSVPASASLDVVELASKASSVWLADPNSAANLLRRVVESVLTDRKIRRFSSSGGKRSRINLHDRILEYGRKGSQAAADALMAVKWLGNDGSHSGNLSRAQLIEAARLLDHALELAYADTRAVSRTISRINKAKGARGLAP